MILYAETISDAVCGVAVRDQSDAVHGVASGRDRTCAATPPIGCGSSVLQSGSGVVQDNGGTHHFDSDNLWGGKGGQGARRT